MPQTNVKHWRRLDNAAKLFPAASSKRDTRVFRFYCELKEDIQQEILQKAVDRTLEKYPIFLSVLRKGLFWHIMRMDWRMWFCQSIRRAFSIRKQMDLKDIIPARQTAKRRKNRQRISFAETGVSLEACRRQRQKFRSKN